MTTLKTETCSQSINFWGASTLWNWNSRCEAEQTHAVNSTESLCPSLSAPWLTDLRFVSVRKVGGHTRASLFNQCLHVYIYMRIISSAPCEKGWKNLEKCIASKEREREWARESAQERGVGPSSHCRYGDDRNRDNCTYVSNNILSD